MDIAGRSLLPENLNLPEDILSLREYRCRMTGQGPVLILSPGGTTSGTPVPVLPPVLTEALSGLVFWSLGSPEGGGHSGEFPGGSLRLTPLVRVLAAAGAPGRTCGFNFFLRGELERVLTVTARETLTAAEIRGILRKYLPEMKDDPSWSLFTREDPEGDPEAFRRLPLDYARTARIRGEALPLICTEILPVFIARLPERLAELEAAVRGLRRERTREILRELRESAEELFALPLAEILKKGEVPGGGPEAILPLLNPLGYQSRRLAEYYVWLKEQNLW